MDGRRDTERASGEAAQATDPLTALDRAQLAHDLNAAHRHYLTLMGRLLLAALIATGLVAGGVYAARVWGAVPEPIIANDHDKSPITITTPR